MKSHEDDLLVLSFVERHSTVMLTSFEGGSLRARPMQVVQSSYNGTLYFFTPAHSGLVKEIAQAPTVSITFADKAASDYLALTGRADISMDKNMYGELWNKEMDLWFPKGINGGEAVLLEVAIKEGECWKSKGMFVRLYEHAKAIATDGTPELSDHRKFVS